MDKPPETPSEPELLSVDQVATLLNCSERLVWSMTASGQLPAPCLLRRRMRRWRREELMDWIRTLPTTTTATPQT
jgi:excisionase family DNA binding protein